MKDSTIVLIAAVVWLGIAVFQADGITAGIGSILAAISAVLRKLENQPIIINMGEPS